MAIFKRLIQNPSSPDKDIKATSGPAKYKQSTFARLTDTNALSRDVFDQKLYTVDLAAGFGATVPILSKRGVVKISNATTSGAQLTISLSNSELLAVDVDKYWIQGTVATATSTILPVVRVVPISADGSITFNIKTASGGSIDWSTNPVYLHYQIVKIGD